MSDRLPTNWISAHFDGELSADEAALADRRLKEDAAAREEWKDYAVIRALFVDLPMETPPSGFSAAVTRRCEHGMLLPATERDGGSNTAGSWRPVLAGLLSTVAVLFLIVRIATTPDGQQVNKSADNAVNKKAAVARSSNSQPGGGDATVADNRDPAKESLPEGPSAAPMKTRTANSNVASSPNNTNEQNQPQSVAGNKSDDGRTGRTFKGDGGQLLSKFRRDGMPAIGKLRREAFRVGDVIPYLEVKGERTAVIEVTVVDVQRAVGRIEVLLAKHAITPDADPRITKNEAANGKQRLIKPSFRLKKGPTQQLIAVYVESTEPQLAAVMAALGKQTGAVHLSLKRPLEYGEVRASQIAHVEDESKALKSAASGTRSNTSRTFADAVLLARRTATGNPTTGMRTAGRFRRKEIADGFGGKKLIPRKSAAPPRIEKKSKRSAKAAAPAGAAFDAKSKRNQPKDKDGNAARPDSAAPSFRMWLALDDQPGRQSAANRAEKTAIRQPGAKFAVRGAKSLKQAKQSLPPAAPFRVIIVLRQQPRPAKAQKP